MPHDQIFIIDFKSMTEILDLWRRNGRAIRDMWTAYISNMDMQEEYAAEYYGWHLKYTIYLYLTQIINERWQLLCRGPRNKMGRLH
jgi:hypothetical protein